MPPQGVCTGVAAMKDDDTSPPLGPRYRRQHGFIDLFAGGGSTPERPLWSPQLQDLFQESGRTHEVQKGAHLIRIGDPFHEFYAVRDGAFKAYSDDTEGREHVMGFFFPGDCLGFDAFHTGRYRANFMALDSSEIYVVPFDALDGHLARSPKLLAEFLARLSRNIARFEVLAGDYTADERVSAFLLSISRRLNGHAGSGGELRLPMSRRDIANHLRLAPETVSRSLDGFARRGLIGVRNQLITIADGPGLADTSADLEIP